MRGMLNSIGFSPYVSHQDMYVWNKTASGLFTIKSAWELLRTSQMHVDGSRILWHSWHVPRYSFILWLATRGRLRTKDRIHGSTNSNPRRALCNVHDEDHNHLLFNCTYSIDVWTVVASKAQIIWPIRPWEQLWAWTIREFGSRSNPRHCMVGLVLASRVYRLWAECNHRVHSLV